MSICSNRQFMQLLFLAVVCAGFAYFILWRVNVLAGTGPRLSPSRAHVWPRGVSDERDVSATQWMGRQQGLLYLHAMVHNGLLDYGPVEQVRITDSWLTDTERQLLQNSPLQDLSTVASPDTSIVTVMLQPPRPSNAASHPPSANQPTTGTSSPRPSNHVAEPFSAFETLPEDQSSSVAPKLSEKVPPRKQTVPLREKNVPLRKDLVPLMRQTVPLSEKTVLLREKTVRPREEAVPLNEDTAPLSEKAVPLRERTVSLRGKTVPLKKETVALRVGDHVTVRVDLKDTSGRAVTTGGAMVRVRALSTAGSARQPGDQPAQRFRAVAGDVSDLGNGSYVTSLPMVWSGEMVVQALLVQPAEFRRALLSLMDRIKMLNQVVATFSSGAAEEVTLCSFLPVIPGYRQVCNLTAANSGLTWYCGRPAKAGVHCGHWLWASNTHFPQRYPGLTQAEQSLIQRVSQQTLDSIQLRDLVTLTVAETDASPPVKRKICHSPTPIDTWTDQSPRGYWDNDQWRPLGCDLPLLTESLLLPCLKDSTVVFLGDSNALQILELLNTTLKCQESEQRREIHQPVHVSCPANLSLLWSPHAFPFYSGVSHWTNVSSKQAPSSVIRSLPSVGRYVILLHLYLHFSPIHPSVYDTHVLDTARAVRELMARNPHVRVLVRGPHAVLGRAFSLAADHHAHRCSRVLHAAFEGLRDRVVLLNAWDMTVARGNMDIHPDAATVRALTSLIITHVCPADLLNQTQPSA